MVRDPISVSPATDQEEVARIVARYDLVAVPVVDGDKRLLGIVTVDDVVDVIREEANEDMMLMAGVADPSEGRTLTQQAMYRAGFLVATVCAGIVASEIIASFNATLAKEAALAGFIPVITGTGGNIGIQSATLAVRGLATDKLQVGGTLPFLWRETRVGLLLGVLLSAGVGGFGIVRHPQDLWVGITIGLSIFVAITWASIVGASLPVLLQRVGLDPAVATGPFVTTLSDLFGIVIYFSIATALLGL
jgi:magnesium transporter